MYLSPMVVDVVQKTIEDLRTTHGEFNLAMLHSETENVEYGWNLIVSAPWTDKLGLAKATRTVVRALSQRITVEQQPAVARVTVLKTSDPFVRELTGFLPMSTPRSRQEIRGVAFDGIPVGRGILFYSQPGPLVGVST
jgi:hypothetical protein